MSEDIYDVGQRETAAMQCSRCGVTFLEYEVDSDHADPDTGEGAVLLSDESCPNCGGDLEKAR